jgi:hypothetical protein
MPFWGWLLVDLGIVLAGAAWWAYLALGLVRRGRKTQRLLQPLIDQANALQVAQETPGDYQKPTDDLHSDPRKMERNLEERKRSQAHWRAERQRRLIARLRK